MTDSATMSHFGFNNPLIQKLVIISFVICTTASFLYLNKVQPTYYIDEVFHIPQTQRYCNGSFFEWDNKITTLPGVYLLSAAILGPWRLCNTIFLRGVSLIGTFLNLYLSYKVLSTMTWIQKAKTENIKWLTLIEALSITLLPPLFFWHFLFYTDVISVNLVLLMILLHQKQYYTSSAAIGALSVLTRQTNIIWVVLLTGERILTMIEAQTPQSIATLVSRGLQGTPIHARLLWNNVLHHVRRGTRPFLKFVCEICSNIKAHLAVIVGFLVFIILNRGIVVGDKSAHKATIHLPQIFYFSVFCLGFSWPYVLSNWRSFFQHIRKHWIITNVLLVLMTIIVHNNTLVHPYLMADNRHYIFYIWSKIMGRYYFVRYLLIPIYGFSLYSIYICLKDLRFLSKLLYIGGICTVLIPQLLLEPRYFIIPYILIRLNMSERKSWQIYAELLTSLAINCLQFYVFVVKTFYWTDQEGPQRLSW